jgi:general secretion pathway protein D
VNKDKNRVGLKGARGWHAVTAVSMAAALAGCAPLVPLLPPTQAVPERSGPEPLASDTSNRTTLRVTAGPLPPAVTPREAVTAPVAAPSDDVVAAVNLQQVALPTFVQVVYAEVLKKNVSLDPAVMARPDLVTFKTGAGQTAAQVETAVRMLLKSYALSVVEVAGLVRVVPDNASQGDLPGIRFGAALPDVPASLRPMFQLVPLQAVRQSDVTGWLRMLFGDRVRVQEDSTRNAVLISGNPDNVKAALEALSVLDQPALKGRSSLTLTPAFWSADELARRLTDVLGAEGYAVHPVGQPITQGGLRNPIILLPVSSLNQIFVFTQGDQVASHVVEWARTLDRPNERGIGKNFFTYAVKHKDAEQLAQTLDRVLGGNGGSSATAAANAQGQAGATGASVASSRLSSVVVDRSTNTLIFQSKPDDYGQLLSLLQSLDKPTKSALIEVTVAELSLTDSAQLGFDWLAGQVKANGFTLTAPNGGLVADSPGLNIQLFNGAGALRTAINALASNNRATILSSPRLLARNGESATIQVGDEVPTISAQQTTAVGGTNSNGLLQTVQYRTTGVILKVKPVIHSGDQIDLDVEQEVSEASQTKTGVTNSPTIATRKVQTKLTLRNGGTVMLGGLISGSGSQGNSGIPFLKDIPVLGSLFASQARSGARRELVILITPYIANDSQEAEAISDTFRRSLGDWARPESPAVSAADSKTSR